MQPTSLLASIALLAASISTPLLATDREHDQARQNATEARSEDGFDHGMKVVANSAAADSPGYGWQYFSDPAARRAVVISPQGDYYYSSHGKGLRWIAAVQI
ncbi:MAG: hypothetical protein ACTS5V_04230 [Giesbergeria sp.]